MPKVAWLVLLAPIGCAVGTSDPVGPLPAGSRLEISAPTSGIAGELLDPVTVRLVLPDDASSAPIGVSLFVRRLGDEGFLGEQRTADRAVFEDLRLQAGTVSFVARAEGLADVESAPLEVLSRAVALRFLVQPQAVVQGAPISPAIEVEVVDAAGTRVPLDAVVIDLLWRGGGGRSASATTVDGVAVFAGVVGDAVRSDAVLEAVTPGLTTAVSAPFGVFAAPTSLAWVVPPPAWAFAGRPMPLEVEALDARGDRVGDQALTFLASVFEGSGTLGGATTTRVSSGLADFSDLHYTSTLTLRASESIRIRVAVGAVTLISDPIEVRAAPPTMHRASCPDGSRFYAVGPLITISDDGRWIVFHSNCTLDGEIREGLFRVDTRTGQSELLDGYPPPFVGFRGDSMGALAGDGASMAFVGVPSLYGLVGEQEQLLRRDFVSRAVEIWGYLPDGNVPDIGVAPSAQSLSANGRAVVFAAATSTVPAAYYLRVAGQPTVQVAVTAPIGAPGVALSADGGRVVFVSSERLEAADQDDARDYYVYDVATATTRLAIGGLGPLDRDDESRWGGPVVDHSASSMLFSSQSELVVPSDNNRAWDVFLADLATGGVERVSVDGLGQETVSSGLDSDCFRPHSEAGWLSGDARFVIFASCAENLIADDTNALRDVFVKDRSTGELVRLNVLEDGSQVMDGGGSRAMSLSRDGTTAVIITDARIGADTDGELDLYWVDNPLAR
jgi:hypothetical protein